MKKLFIFLILGILLVGTLGFFILQKDKTQEDVLKPTSQIVQTAQGEIIKEYSPSEKLLILKDIETESETLSAKLNTAQDYKVGAGYGKVAQFTINSYQDYENILGQFELYDKRNNDVLISRQIDVKYLTVQQVEENVYGKGKCSLKANGTETCEQIVVGTKLVEKEVWLPFDNSVKTNEEIIIGLFTDVQVGDKVEWIPMIAGVRVQEWAVWTAGLNVGLVSYFKLDETSGVTAVDSHGSNDLTNTGMTVNQAGIIGTSYLGGNNTYMNESTGFGVFTGDHSVSLWMYHNYLSTYQGVYHAGDSNLYYPLTKSTGEVILVLGGRPTSPETPPGTIVTGAWQHLVITRENDDWKIYVAGVSVENHTESQTITGTRFLLANDYATLGGRGLQGKIDEVGVWNRTLTPAEVTQLYNSGAGITYIVEEEFEIILLSPENNTNFTTNTISFSANVSNPGALGIQNVSLEVIYPNGTLFYDETNDSGIEGIYNWTNITIPDGNWNWSVNAYNDTDKFYESLMRIFSIDTIAPEINVSFPNETITFHEKNTNLSLNWTATDEHLSSCWYNWDGTNVSVTCGDNSTSFNITDGTNKNLIFYVNDTFGNKESQTVTWEYRLFLEEEIFDSTIVEGSDSTFSANFLTNGSDITIAILYYNETTNTGAISNHGGNNFTISKIITIPSVDADTNLSFYWNITQGLLNFALDPKNQTVLNLGIDDCSVFTTLIFNYTIVDEEKQDFLEDPFNTTLELDLNLFSLDKSRLISSFSKSYGDTNPATVCLNINLTNATMFSLDSIVRYEALNHTNEYYNLQGFTLKNSTIPQVITLFSLLSEDSTEFQITFKDSNFAVVENALIQINRQYISEGVFKTVEIPKTDANGQTVAHLVEKEVIYNFIVIKDNVILGTFNNVIAFCQDAFIGNCFIYLNAIKAGTVVFDYDEEIGLAFSFSYNESSRLLQFPFTTLDGGVKNVSLLAIKLDQLGNTTACSQSLVTSSGTILCPVPVSIGNATLIVEIFVEGDLKITNYIPTGTPFDLGEIGYFLMFFLVLSLALMMTQSKIAVILGVVLGFISSTLLSFVKGGILAIGSSITWLVIMAIILIWKLNSQAQT